MRCIVLFLSALAWTAALLPAQTATETELIATIRSLVAAKKYNDAGRELIRLTREIEARTGRVLPQERTLKAGFEGAGSPLPPEAWLDRAEASLRAGRSEEAELELEFWAATFSVGAIQTRRPQRDVYLEVAEDAEERRSSLQMQHAAELAFRAHDLAAAELMNARALALLKEFPAPVSAATILGRYRIHSLQGMIYLEQGKSDRAAAELMASVAGFDSSQWPLGPGMALAQRMLLAGQRDPVIHYLEACGKVGWKEGKEKLPVWIASIKAGSMPSFDPMNLVR